MPVDIKRISDDQISVNGHLIYLDANNNWNGGQYLNATEQQAAANYVAALVKKDGVMATKKDHEIAEKIIKTLLDYGYSYSEMIPVIRLAKEKYKSLILQNNK